jgi:AcrR family transcriptional regulator
MAAQLPDPRPSLERRERADAAHNRRRVLAAAEELFASRGARAVTMEDIARAAGVGKGTLYRRFPDRASIAVALLDEHERALQERLLRGPPPLGPGAPPAERLAPELYQHLGGRSAADVTAALTHLARAALGRPDGDRGTA